MSSKQSKKLCADCKLWTKFPLVGVFRQMETGRISMMQGHEEGRSSIQEITDAVAHCADELFAVARMEPGQILVLGCSTSEVIGEKIGTHSSEDVAKAIVGTLLCRCEKEGVYFAAQCCEHLNRSLIIERACMQAYGWEEVSVRPAPTAGGAMATEAWAHFSHPVAVERIRAHAGIDIGDTLVGMHLRPVAVPVRPSDRRIGAANVVMARTRPKYVGGPRAHYDPE